MTIAKSRTACVLITCLIGWGCGGKASNQPSVQPVSDKAGPAPGDLSGQTRTPNIIKLDPDQPAVPLPPRDLGGGIAAQSEPAAPATEPAGPIEGLEGSWRMTISADQEATPLWIIEIRKVGDAYEGKIIDTALRRECEIKDIDQSDQHVRFAISIGDRSATFDGRIGSDRVQGSLELPGKLVLAWLQPTKENSLRSAALLDDPADTEFRRLQQTENPKELAARITDFMDKHPESPLFFDAGRMVLELAKSAELGEDEIRKTIASIEEQAAAWGERWTKVAIENVAKDLGAVDAYPAIALDYARKAEANLEDDASTSRNRFVRLALAVALVRNGQAEEGKRTIDELLDKEPEDSEAKFYRAAAEEKLGDLDAAIETLVSLWPHPLVNRELKRVWQEKHGGLEGFEERLDQAYARAYPPLPVDSYERPKQAESNHVVLAELFTGSSCPPCVAADVAFDALNRAFQRSDLVLLQYHLHVPGPDPLTNASSEARAQYYRVPGTPSMLLDGEEAGPAGGPRQAGEIKYTELRGNVTEKLDTKSDAKIDLSAHRDGDVLTVEAKLSGVPDPSDQLRLRFALVETEVRFMGSNGVRLHHAVVRDMPGGSEGTAVTETSMEHAVTVNLPELRQALTQSLESLEKEGSFEFPAKPLELNRLAVVAFLQDDKTHKVLESAFVTLQPEDTTQEARVGSPQATGGVPATTQAAESGGANR